MRFRFVAALACGLLVAAALAGSGVRSAGAEEYDRAKLDAFVTAIMEVSQRIEAWRPRIEGAESEEVRNALAEEAEADLARAVAETEGITQEEYWEIYNEARENDSLRQRIDALLSARR